MVTPSKAGTLALFAGLLTATLAQATEPWEKRDFGGRICIILNGAGTQGPTEPLSQALDAVSALKALVADSSISVPAVLLSSDEKVRESKIVRQLEQSGSLTSFRASKEGFEKLVSKDGYLQSLKARLANLPQFKTLVKPGEDVSRYLKIEIVIASHSARTNDEHPTFRGLPVWEFDSQTGSATAHLNAQGPVLTKMDFQRLYAIFPDAVFHAFLSICDSANMGEMFAPDRALLPPGSRVTYSFVGGVAKDVIMPTRADGSTDDLEHPEQSLWGDHFTTYSTKGKWQGASSLLELSLSMFDYFRTNARVRLKNDMTGSLFELAPLRPNPYEHLAVKPLDGDLEMTPEVRLAFNSDNSSTRNQRGDTAGSLVVQIDRLIQKEEGISSRFLASQFRLQENFVTMTDLTRNFLGACFLKGAEPDCGHISAVINRAKRNGNPRLREMFSSLYQDVGHYRDKTQYFIGSEKGFYKPLPSSDQARLDRFRDEISRSRDKWIEFRDTVLSEAFGADEGMILRGEFEVVSRKIAAWHQSFLQAYYPDLVKAVLDQRVQRLKDHVRKVVEKAKGSETDPIAVGELKNIRDQLALLTQIPVGPAFDRKYVRPKLQKEGARSASGR